MHICMYIHIFFPKSKPVCFFFPSIRLKLRFHYYSTAHHITAKFHKLRKCPHRNFSPPHSKNIIFLKSQKPIIPISHFPISCQGCNSNYSLSFWNPKIPLLRLFCLFLGEFFFLWVYIVSDFMTRREGLLLICIYYQLLLLCQFYFF